MRRVCRAKYVRNLTEKEYQDCYRLNYGSIGLMRGQLSYSRSQKNDDRVILIYEADTLVGWTLLFKGWNDHTNAHFYVRATHRQRGIGTRLANRTVKLAPGAKVFPHDVPSQALFKKVSGFRVEKTTH